MSNTFQIEHLSFTTATVPASEYIKLAVLDNAQTWQTIVHDGALAANGMVGFSQSLSAERIEGLRQYVIFRANQDKELGGIGNQP